MGGGKGKSKRVAASQTETGITAYDYINELLSLRTRGFSTSVIVKKSEKSQREVEEIIEEMLSKKVLRKEYEVSCPNTGRTITRISGEKGEALLREAAPSMIACSFCDEQEHKIEGGSLHMVFRGGDGYSPEIQEKHAVDKVSF